MTDRSSMLRPACRTSRLARVLRFSVLLAVVIATARALPAQSEVRGWGRFVFDSSLHQEAFVEVEAGYNHTLARRADGSVVAWGSNGVGQCNVPPAPTGLTYTALAAGWVHTLALRSDGLIAACGYNVSGQCNVPPLPVGLAYVAITAGDSHSAALRSDGSIVARSSDRRSV